MRRGFGPAGAADGRHPPTSPLAPWTTRRCCGGAPRPSRRRPPRPPRWSAQGRRTWSARPTPSHTLDRVIDRLTALEDEFRSVEARLSDPKVFEDNAAYVKLTRLHKQLEPIVAAVRARRQAAEDLATAREMLDGSSGDDRDMVRAEINDAEATI